MIKKKKKKKKINKKKKKKKKKKNICFLYTYLVIFQILQVDLKPWQRLNNDKLLLIRKIINLKNNKF